jgi:3-hydroxyacyl-CoA dehydrogenase
MTIEELIKKLEQQQKDVRNFIENRLPHIVGVEAVNFYEEL